MKLKRTKILLIVIIINMILLTSINSRVFFKNSIKLDVNQEILQSKTTSYTQQWLENENFTTTPIEPTWYWASSGDVSDLEASTETGQANLKVLGDKGTFSLAENTINGSNWEKVSNQDFPILPRDGNGIDNYGCYAKHTWDESSDQTGNTPSVLFKRNITMTVNMSDYEITSASISGIVNATASENVDCPTDTAAGGSGGGNFIGDVYDSVRFFISISDLGGIYEYELAYNKTRDLGLGNPPGTSTMGDTYLIPMPEELLIYYLNSVLQDDHYNFTIILGIFIYCEDNNDVYDLDTWTELRIKSFNLTFTYEKKIDRGAYISWNQIGNKLPDPPINGSVSVDEASLFFKYKIDQNWTSNSPNSEIRLLINNKSCSETIKLSKINNTFTEAKSNGFDVSSLISTTENITPSIQLYLADNFILDSNTTISIDDVVLIITYTIFEPDALPPAPFNWWLIILPLIFGLIALGSVFAAYQYHFKIPRIIRIIRKLKKNIKTNNVSKEPLDLNSRTNLTTTINKKQAKSLTFEIKKTTGESK